MLGPGRDSKLLRSDGTWKSLKPMPKKDWGEESLDRQDAHSGPYQPGLIQPTRSILATDLLVHEPMQGHIIYEWLLESKSSRSADNTSFTRLMDHSRVGRNSQGNDVGCEGEASRLRGNGGTA